MTRDELRQPLRKPTLAERVKARSPNAFVTACVISALVFGGAGAWVASIPHPFAGEPIVMAAIPAVEQVVQAAPVVAELPPEPEADAASDAPSDFEAEPDAAVDSDNDGPRVFYASRRSLKPAPIASVAETTTVGILPRIAHNGKRPSDIYAQTLPLSLQSSDKPKIAILLGGMGLNARLTEKATNDLPGDISFGFAPYGEDLQSKVNAARAYGHEVMLQVPMEPVSYPADNPGPNTLLAEASKEENMKALRWGMSRFVGYIGITNYMGSRFLASPKSLKPALAEMKSRGLVFLEDAGVVQSAVEQTARATGLRSRKADLVIDAAADEASIRAALAQLEELALSTGLAVGTGTGLEITIDTLTGWIDELETKGITLVPMSAAYQGRMS